MTETENLILDDVPYLIEREAINGRDYLKAAAFLRDKSFWTQWAIRALLALVAGHILSGIIFLFAFNWNDLSGIMKFSVVGGGIIACLAAWIVAKLDSPLGQVFGIGATVLVGVMFAVLGQVYQTPAMIHTPFVFWAILTLPFALASRNLAHWTVWLVIATVAIAAFGNSGLRLDGQDEAANLVNIGVGGLFLLGLMGVDNWLSPRMSWARAEWFRVVLILGVAGFAITGFTESLWEEGLFWILAFSLICAALAYLYLRAPSRATLSLVSFGLFIALAQLGVKLILEIGDDVGGFFLSFIWLIGLTIGLVAAFRRFLKSSKYEGEFARRPDSQNISRESETGNSDSFSQSVTVFSEHIGIDSRKITNAMSSQAERDQPWYMHVFLALAGILTAIFGCGFVGSLVGLFLTNADSFVFGIIGLVIFVVAIVLRRQTSALYGQHVLNTMIVIGGVLTGYGFGYELREFDSIIFLLISLCVIVLVLVPDRILEFLSAGGIMALVGMELYHLRVPHAESIFLILATGLGVWLLTRPVKSRLYKSSGTAFLMAPAILGIGLVHIHRWDEFIKAGSYTDGWMARLISVAVLVAAVMFLNRGRSPRDFLPPLQVLAPLVIAAALIPLGGASALLLILTGYILGSRSLAIIGSLLQIYFLTMFYYDLSFDLLTKSLILLVSGFVFLGVWFFVHRTEGKTS